VGVGPLGAGHRHCLGWWPGRVVDRSDGHPVVGSRSVETGTRPVMNRYGLRVYKSGDQLWQTHDIFADDDVTAKHLAQQNSMNLRQS